QGWQNGNAGASQAHYAEGESISYRAAVTGLNSGDQVILVIGYDVIHSGVHAIDFLTDLNRWQTPESSAGTLPDLPCSGVSPCAGPVLAAIPAPTTNIFVNPQRASTAACNSTTGGSGYQSQPVTSFNAIPSTQRNFEFYNVGAAPTVAYVGTNPP